MTDPLIARGDALLKEITPVDTPKWKLVRYDHGGGRLYIDGEAGERTLIADFYNEGDREFYSQAPQLVRDLVAELTRLQSLVNATNVRLDEVEQERDAAEEAGMLLLDRRDKSDARADAAEAAPRDVQAQLEQPRSLGVGVDAATDGGRLLLNAYGRKCFDAGFAASDAAIRDVQAQQVQRSYLIEAARYALDEARSTITVDHPVRVHVESVINEIDTYITKVAPGDAADASPIAKKQKNDEKK